MTARSVRRSAALLAMVVALVGVVACSDSSTSSSDRNAAATETYCPRLNDPATLTVKVVNNTRSSFIINVPETSWACGDWSGQYNPGSLEGREVKAGETITARLEYKDVLVDPTQAARGVGGYASGPFLLQLATRKLDGSSWIPLEMGGSGGIQIKKDSAFKGRVPGRTDWTSSTSFTGITTEGVRTAVAWKGNMSQFVVTLGS